MTISLFKYHCALREDGTIVSMYGGLSDELLEEIFDTIGNEPVVFPFRFIFITVNNSRDTTAQLFVLRNIEVQSINPRKFHYSDQAKDAVMKYSTYCA